MNMKCLNILNMPHSFGCKLLSSECGRRGLGKSGREDFRQKQFIEEMHTRPQRIFGEIYERNWSDLDLVFGSIIVISMGNWRIHDRETNPIGKLNGIDHFTSISVVWYLRFVQFCWHNDGARHTHESPSSTMRVAATTTMQMIYGFFPCM